MGRVKKRFNEKKDAVKFTLVYRSTEDPNYQKGTLADRVFQLIEDQKSKKTDPDREAKKAKILSQFSDKDLGKYENPRKIDNFIIEPEESNDHDDKKLEIIEEKLGKKKKKVLKGIEAREDLWINQLRKNKENAQNTTMNPQEKKKTIGEEEWEDFDDDDVEYEIEEYEEEEEENEEESKEKTEEKPKENPKKLPALAEKMLEREDPINIPKNFAVNPNVKMKYYDENGLLIDGYDYYQHIAKKNTEGVVAVVYNAEYDNPPELKPDLDYQPNEMTAEQKEVFEALEFEGNEEAYEKLEDDFVDIANCGEKCLDSKVPMETMEKEELEAIEKELEDDDKLPEVPEILNKHDFKKIVNEYIAHMGKQNDKKAGIITKKPVSEETSEEENEDKDEGIYIKKPDLKPENMNKIDPEYMVTKRTYEKLDPKDDICLQQYLLKDSSEESSDEEKNKKKIDDSPTIEDISGKVNGIQPKLHIIKEKNQQNTRKKERKEKKEETNDKKEEKNDKNDKNDKKEEENNEKINEVPEIFKKREKGETAEEKAERKSKIKVFKQERKEKKQKFKEEFKHQHVTELKKNRPNHNISHVSVYKL